MKFRYFYFLFIFSWGGFKSFFLKKANLNFFFLYDFFLEYFLWRRPFEIYHFLLKGLLFFPEECLSKCNFSWWKSFEISFFFRFPRPPPPIINNPPLTFKIFFLIWIIIVFWSSLLFLLRRALPFLPFLCYFFRFGCFLVRFWWFLGCFLGFVFIQSDRDRLWLWARFTSCSWSRLLFLWIKKYWISSMLYAIKASANKNAIGRFAFRVNPCLTYLGWTFITFFSVLYTLQKKIGNESFP